MSPSPSVRQVLFADSDRSVGRRLVLLARGMGMLAASTETLEETKRALVTMPLSVFCASVTLKRTKSVDLVYLARLANPVIRVVLYGRSLDLIVAREAQRAGAFFETLSSLSRVLPHYFSADLPRTDRRDPARIDRHDPADGARRATDSDLSKAGL